MPRDIKLKKEARFGRIPFDLYALDNWDYEASTAMDGEQWKQTVQKYLRLPSIDRRPHHEAAQNLKTGKNDGSHPNLVHDKIERVLRPFQSNAERNSSELSGLTNPIWVQLCYEKSLEPKYAELAYWAEMDGSMNMEMAMDDETLYDVNEDPELLRQKLLERMPGLCDKTRNNYHASQGQPLDPEGLEDMSQRMETYFLFADKEAIEKEFVKVMWLDAHGESLLITKIVPAQIEGMTTMFGEGFSMQEAIESYCTRDEAGRNREDEDEGDQDEHGDEGEGSGSTKGKRKAGTVPETESSHKRAPIDKRSPGYKAGYKAGYDAGLEAAAQAAQEQEYDMGYHAGKTGQPHRVYGHNFP